MTVFTDVIDSNRDSPRPYYNTFRIKEIIRYPQFVVIIEQKIEAKEKNHYTAKHGEARRNVNQLNLYIFVLQIIPLGKFVWL